MKNKCPKITWVPGRPIYTKNGPICHACGQKIQTYIHIENGQRVVGLRHTEKE